MMRRIQKGASTRRGSAAMEFSIWLVVLLMILSAVIDYGDYMARRTIFARGVMDGARAGAAFREPTGVPEGEGIKAEARQRTIDILDDTNMRQACIAPQCVVESFYCVKGSDSCGCPPDDPTNCSVVPFDGVLVTLRAEYEPWFGLVAVPTIIREEFLMAVETQKLTP